MDILKLKQARKYWACSIDPDIPKVKEVIALRKSIRYYEEFLMTLDQETVSLINSLLIGSCQR